MIAAAAVLASDGHRGHARADGAGSARHLRHGAQRQGAARFGAVVGGDLVTNPFVVTEVYVLDHDGWALASMSFTRLITRP